MTAHHNDLDEPRPTFGHAVAVVQRRFLGVALCVIVATGAALLVSELQTKQYTATASLLFNNNQTSQQVAGLQPTVNNNQQSQQDTNVALVQIGDMAAKTASYLGGGLTKQQVLGDLSITPQGDTTVVRVAATSTSPALSARMANAYANFFVAEQQAATSDYYKSALATVTRQLTRLSPRQRQGVQGLALQDRAQSLATLAQLRAGVQVAAPAALPTAPSSPRVARNGAVGLILGLLVGLAIAIALERFDQRLREPADLAAVYDLPLLGIVPESTALAGARRKTKDHAEGALAGRDAEVFHLINVQLQYFSVDREIKALVVASAAPGDGKTTIASCLASAMTATGARVLLIETDLRRPQLDRQLGLRRHAGLSDVLVGVASMEDALQTVSEEWPRSYAAPDGSLDVLVSGLRTPPNPGQLLQSQAMEAVLANAKEAYDLVVIDTPPLAAVSDAFPLLSKVDGIVMVGWVGRNRRDIALHLAETLDRVGAPMLGVVANGVKARLGGAYGYAYEPRDREMPDADDLPSSALDPGSEAPAHGTPRPPLRRSKVFGRVS